MDVNARLAALIENAKKFLGDDVLSAPEYVQFDDGLPVLNAQTDEEIVKEVNRVWERKKVLEAVVAGIGAKKDKTQEGSGIQMMEGESEIGSHSTMSDVNSSELVPLQDLIPLITEVVKDVIKKEGKKTNKLGLPPKQKTIDSFFKVKKK
jgi:hypothetical protein